MEARCESSFGGESLQSNVRSPENGTSFFSTTEEENIVRWHKNKAKSRGVIDNGLSVDNPIRLSGNARTAISMRPFPIRGASLCEREGSREAEEVVGYFSRARSQRRVREAEDVLRAAERTLIAQDAKEKACGH